MNRQILIDDINAFAEQFELWEQLRGKTFLITGATGLIGSVMTKCLLELNRQKDLGIKVIAVVRSLEKAEKVFAEEAAQIKFYQLGLNEIGIDSIRDHVDYVIHCAAPTASKFFVEHPVETFNTICQGTTAILEYAKSAKIESMVYLSSLEVYGSIYDDNKPVTEDVQGYLDPMTVRSSYPMAKRATENLCCLYANEYQIPVKVARLTQTTGAGIAKDDNRIIAQFARLAAEGKDIILHTTGESARPYCYTTDAISAILYILLKGKNGETYNVANEDTYISAREMAEYLQANFNPNINVRLELNDNMGYAPVSRQRLSSSKLVALGWTPRYGLKEIFEKLIEYLKIQK